MSDQQQAIATLIEKIEAGDATYAHFRCLETPMQDIRYTQIPNDARLAYKGSLDAALSLHEALVPNRPCGITFGGEYGATVTFPPTWDDLHLSQSHIVPARAWLLAILRAYASQLSAASNRKGAAE